MAGIDSSFHPVGVSVKLQKGWLLTGLLTGGSVTYIATGNPEYVGRLAAEDGAVEQLSALFWICGFITAMVKLSIARVRWQSRLFILMWGVFCLICGGEEISWGQRIIGFETPEAIKSVNHQGEFNIHNLEAFNVQSMGWYDFLSGGWYDVLRGKRSGDLVPLFFSLDKIFAYGYFLYFFVLPILAVKGKFKRLLAKIIYIPQDQVFIVALWATIGLSFILSLFAPHSKIQPLYEIREMYYAFFAMLYVYYFIPVASSNNRSLSFL